MTRIKVLYIFRKKRPGFHSIENLFSSIQKALPDDIKFENLELPWHEGIVTKSKNILFVLQHNRFIKKFDVIHITGDITYITPFLPGKKIVTFHDIGSLTRETSSLKNFFLGIFWIMLPSLFADKITVISDFTRKELTKEYPFVARKIDYIPNCLPDEWLYNCRKDGVFAYKVLTVGTKANKNLQNIIKALDGTRARLIIVGKLNDQIAYSLNNSDLQYVVYYDLSYEQMKRLYHQADILLFPSFYEGFGLPVIEAQAVGIPVITSKIEPMTSVAGEAALKVNPYNVGEIREAVQKLFSDSSLRKQLVEKGFLNVKKYLCSSIARQYADLYKQLKNTQENV